MSEPVIIGPATLYYGDAYQIRPQLGFFDADCFDPPYAFRAEGGGRYRAERPGMDRIADEALHTGFDLRIINPLLCGAVVAFAHNDQLAELLTFVNGSFERHALCVWQKANPQPLANKHYRPDVEFYVHAWNRGYHPQGELTEKHRLRRVSSPRGDARFDHPTCKPDELMASIIRNLAGDSICDPFMGTGSTGVAAVRAGRRFTGIEHNPRHFETAVARIRAAVAAMERPAPIPTSTILQRAEA
jgi:site-specific DNA-methyltransferase (adenine-specific)